MARPIDYEHVLAPGIKQTFKLDVIRIDQDGQLEPVRILEYYEGANIKNHVLTAEAVAELDEARDAFLDAVMAKVNALVSALPGVTPKEPE